MIYFLPGRNERLNGKLGQQIMELGFDMMGREIIGEFELLPISKQLELICADIKENFWSKEHKIIARSYGGYLIIHALMEYLPDVYPGKILLFSPVLGSASISMTYGSLPPRRKKILEYAKMGKLQKFNIELHTGDKDIGCDYKLALEIFSYMSNSTINIVKDATHHLDQSYIKTILKQFLYS